MFSYLSTYGNGEIKNKEILTKSESRLLGQLAVVKFCNVTDGQPVSLQNFHRSKNIKLAKLPMQYKLGDEQHNERLFKSRIKTGRTWMGYLPIFSMTG